MDKRSIAKNLLLAGAAALVSACGGGGGGGPATTTVAVTAAENPVLVSYTSNRVTATLPNTVANGTLVTFAGTGVTFSPSNQVGTTGGVATVRVKSATPGKYAVSASASATGAAYAGNTNVTFINQPAKVKVFVGLAQQVANIGGMQFSVVNTSGASWTGPAAFANYSTPKLSSGLTVPNYVAPTFTSGTVSVTPFSATANSPLFRVTYDVASPLAGAKLPTFSLSGLDVLDATSGLSLNPLPTGFINWKFDTDTF